MLWIILTLSNFMVFLKKMKIFTLLFNIWMVEHFLTILMKYIISESKKLFNTWGILSKQSYIFMKGLLHIEILNLKILSFLHKELLNFVTLDGRLSSKPPEKLTVEHLIMPLLKFYNEKIMICQLMYGVLVCLLMNSWLEECRLKAIKETKSWKKLSMYSFHFIL